MKQFIKNKTVNKINNLEKIDKFINIFNEKIKVEENPSVNTILDNIPRLNNIEFKLITIQARKNGYILTKHEDNYQSITYRLKPIN